MLELNVCPDLNCGKSRSCYLEYMTVVEVLTLVIALLSAALSALAAFISYQTKNDFAVHNRVSVRPHLNMIFGVEHKPEDDGLKDVAVMKIMLINNGLGPALVDKFVLYVDKKEVVSNSGRFWEAAVEMLLSGSNFTVPPYLAYSSFNLGNDFCIAPNSSAAVFTIKYFNENHNEIMSALGRSSSIVTYHSFHGDAYKYDSLEEKKQSEKAT
jgi:hypothetical protein